MKFHKIFGLEMLFVILLLVSTFSFMYFIRINIDEVNQYQDEYNKWSDFLESGKTQITKQDANALDTVTNTIKGFVFKLIIGTILFLVAFILISTLIKTKQWCILLNKKFNKNLFFKLTKITSIFYITTVLLTIIMVFASKNAQISVFVPILAMYFAQYAYPLLIKNKKIKKIFSTGFNKLYLLIIPFIYFIIGVIITSILFKKVYEYHYTYFILYMILIALFLTSHKYIVNKVIKNV